MPDRPELTPQRMKYAGLWRIAIAVVDAAYGLIFVFGGTANAAYQQVMKEVMPMSLWGAVLVLVGALMFSRYLKTAGVLGASCWFVFGIASMVTLIARTAESDAAPVLLGGFAVFHMLITYGAARGLAAARR